MTDSQTLLAEYTQSGSEHAFRELVARYLNFVYSTAARLVGSDCLLAEDVTQTVFVHLAQKAHRLPNDVMLGGWLHRDNEMGRVATMLRSSLWRPFRARLESIPCSNPGRGRPGLCSVDLSGREESIVQDGKYQPLNAK